MIKLPRFAINKLNKTNSATNKMVESVCILRLFWLFDDIKISTKSIQKSKDIKINKKR
jgi:hypothetical protein